MGRCITHAAEGFITYILDGYMYNSAAEGLMTYILDG